MLRLLLIVVSLAVIQGAGTAQTPTQPPQYEETACSHWLPLTIPARCGHVSVPEARDPDVIPDESDTLRLAVIVSESDSETRQPDPIIFLGGGPGAHILWLADDLMNFLRQNYPDRDIIVFDQRGVGASEADLTCPAIAELGYELLNAPPNPAIANARFKTELLACHRAQSANGVNHAAYTTTASATDIIDIADALGYEQINLIGVSYGTRLALETLRAYPERIRSAILDSAVPPQIDILGEMIYVANDAFEQFFARCAADTACATRYPDLRADFYANVARLNADPVRERFYDRSSGIMRQVTFNGSDMINTTFNMMYNTSRLMDLPGVIAAARDGRYEPYIDFMLFNLAGSGHNSDSLFMTMTCREEFPFHTRDDERLAQLSPDFREAMLSNLAFFDETCDALGLPPANARINTAVYSDVPVLLLSGDLDPVTPPTWAALAAETLSQSAHYTFMGYGHALSGDHPCIVALAQDFLAAPESLPQPRCPDEMVTVGVP